MEPGPRPSLIGDRLAWAQALPALISGNNDLAEKYAEAALEVPEKKAWYPGLGDAIGAFVSDDGPMLSESLERVLAKHVRYARNKTSHCHNWGPCLICIPAAVLMRLAAWRGITLRELKGRRAEISFHLMISRPGERVKIQVDFLPDGLTSA